MIDTRSPQKDILVCKAINLKVKILVKKFKSLYIEYAQTQQKTVAKVASTKDSYKLALMQLKKPFGQLKGERNLKGEKTELSQIVEAPCSHVVLDLQL